jgi:hypothetical protein
MPQNFVAIQGTRYNLKNTILDTYVHSTYDLKNMMCRWGWMATNGCLWTKGTEWMKPNEQNQMDIWMELDGRMELEGNKQQHWWNYDGWWQWWTTITMVMAMAMDDNCTSDGTIKQSMSVSSITMACKRKKRIFFLLFIVFFFIIIISNSKTSFGVVHSFPPPKL